MMDTINDGVECSFDVGGIEGRYFNKRQFIIIGKLAG